MDNLIHFVYNFHSKKTAFALHNSITFFFSPLTLVLPIAFSSRLYFFPLPNRTTKEWLEAEKLLVVIAISLLTLVFVTRKATSLHIKVLFSYPVQNLGDFNCVVGSKFQLWRSNFAKKHKFVLVFTSVSNSTQFSRGKKKKNIT